MRPRWAVVTRQGYPDGSKGDEIRRDLFWTRRGARRWMAAMSAQRDRTMAVVLRRADVEISGPMYHLDLERAA